MKSTQYKVSLRIEAIAYIGPPMDWSEDMIKEAAEGSVSLRKPNDPAIELELESVNAEDIVEIET